MVVDKVDRIVNIKREISNLQSTLCMIQDIVQVAEEMQIDNDYIRKWPRDLNDVGYEARDVLEEFITSCTITASKPVNFINSLMPSCFCGSSKLPLATLNRLANDIRSVREKFDEKKQKGELFTILRSVAGGGGSERVRVDCRWPVGPLINRDDLLLGRGEVKEGIMEKLLHPSDDHCVHVVAIWRMRGIRKTTLAQFIYKDERIKEDDYPTENRGWFWKGEKKFSVKKIVNDQNTTGNGEV